MAQCRAPRCEAIKGDRCRCPNPWTEFVSKTVHDRRRRNEPKLSRQQLSTAYRDARDSGQFVPPQHLLDKVAPCKTDIYKLCAWRAKRKLPGVKDVDWRKLKGNVAKSQLDKRIAAFIEQEENGPAVHVTQNQDFRNAFARLQWGAPPPTATIADMRDKVARKLGRDDLKVQRYIAGGIAGSVFEVKRTEANGNVTKAVIKIVLTRDGQEWTNFVKEVDKQKRFARSLERGLETKTLHIPKVYDMWRLPDNMHAAVLMESIDGPLASFVRKYRDKPSFLLEIARQLKRTVASLRREKLVHGDLHWSNIGYKLLPNGKIEVFIIDFGRSLGPLTQNQLANVDDIDRWCVWRASCGAGTAGAAFNKALHEVGFPGSKIMNEYTNLGSKPVNNGTDRNLIRYIDDKSLIRYFQLLHLIDPTL